ncbi:MAG: sulfatase, partial [Verrucomicrobia bacterium]|nr:sulfatase [Verrucomicrobiota bacterium]
PNVIIVLIDDMGLTDLSCYGSKFYESPNIDQLAKDGVRFTHGYSACTVCSPTRAALLTGKYPARLHITDWIPGHERPKAKMKIPEWQKFLPFEEITLAEQLKSAGYATASIGKWHLTPGLKEGDEAYYPDKHGFDINIGGYARGQPPSYFSPYKIPTLTDGPVGEYLTDREANEAVKFIEANKAKPFFLYLPHYAVHQPIAGKPEVVAKFKAKDTTDLKQKNATYAALISSVDDAMGTIRAALKRLKIDEQTIIIFTSDNGGLIGTTDNSPLRAGKGSAYEGGVRVPLIMFWPGVTKAGTLEPTPAISIDIYPTVLEMTGIKPLQSLIDGNSLATLLKSGAKPDRDTIFWHYPHYHPGGATPYSAIRSGDYRLVHFYEDGHDEMYNVANRCQ